MPSMNIWGDHEQNELLISKEKSKKQIMQTNGTYQDDDRKENKPS